MTVKEILISQRLDYLKYERKFDGDAYSLPGKRMIHTVLKGRFCTLKLFRMGRYTYTTTGRMSGTYSTTGCGQNSNRMTRNTYGILQKKGYCVSMHDTKKKNKQQHRKQLTEQRFYCRSSFQSHTDRPRNWSIIYVRK